MSCSMKEIVGLKEKYRDYFKIGAAVNAASIVAHGDLLKRHFNSITAENATKPAVVCPEDGFYHFEEADQIADFAVENGLALRGHTLVWHAQVPDWWFQGADRGVLFARLERHMRVMAERYPQMYCWDVVNEAVEDHESYLLRKSRWLELCGEGYLDAAFHAAKRIFPEADLYYNDYSEFRPDKCKKMIALVKGMLERGVPVDGVGLQCHWTQDQPTMDELRRGMEAYAELGLKIQVTEMDLSVYDFDDRSVGTGKPDPQRMELQAKRYGEAFRVFREYREVMDCVTLWGVSDDMTWLDYFPVERKNWPLLFDEQGQPKEAYWRIIDF